MIDIITAFNTVVQDAFLLLSNLALLIWMVLQWIAIMSLLSDLGRNLHSYSYKIGAFEAIFGNPNQNNTSYSKNRYRSNSGSSLKLGFWSSVAAIIFLAYFLPTLLAQDGNIVPQGYFYFYPLTEVLGFLDSNSITILNSGIGIIFLDLIRFLLFFMTWLLLVYASVYTLYHLASLKRVEYDRAIAEHKTKFLKGIYFMIGFLLVVVPLYFPYLVTVLS